MSKKKVNKSELFKTHLWQNAFSLYFVPSFFFSSGKLLLKVNVGFCELILRLILDDLPRTKKISSSIEKCIYREKESRTDGVHLIPYVHTLFARWGLQKKKRSSMRWMMSVGHKSYRACQNTQ